VCVVALVACARPAPESALRQAISDLRVAIDEKDASAIEGHLAEDFIGPDGLDRQAAKRLATGLFLRNRDIGARFGPLDLQLRGVDHATVRFTAVVTGGTGGLLPESGQAYEVRTGWRFADGRWQLTSAEWKPEF
jgi:ketosteroid isomerase-like protein